jgi:hypothetical protein
LHTVVVLSHTPVTALHEYESHASLLGHVTLGVYWHTLSKHESIVHSVLSLQTVNSSVAVFERDAQPELGSQNATRHLSDVVQDEDVLVYTHALDSQSSTVQALLSLHVS